MATAALQEINHLNLLHSLRLIQTPIGSHLERNETKQISNFYLIYCIIDLVCILVIIHRFITPMNVSCGGNIFYLFIRHFRRIQLSGECGPEFRATN